MSTIPAGLRADLMRQRMEDKATITSIGGLYVGGTTPATYYNPDGTTISAYETELLEPGTADYPLVSNGEGQIPQYQQLKTVGIEDAAITKVKLGNGTVVSGDNNKKILNFYEDENDTNVLIIEYVNAN